MNGQRGKTIHIENKNDVWDYIKLLKKESDEAIKTGSQFTTLINIFEQLPFFCCNNIILDEESQEDISRYVYCTETNTPAYSGSYEDTPSIWIDKYYIIKNAIAVREKQLMEKQNAR